ncbi:MAG: redoxin domain-containing protein [Clostridia bacterium]|nr:redoxin domain-containing protein [Clostridia bacterium]
MKKNKLLAVILSCLLGVFVVCTVLYFNFFDKQETSVYDVLKDAPSKDYNVSIKTEGGMLLSDIDVFVYFDSSLEKLIDYGKTDKDGKVNFTLAEYDNYAIVFSGIEKGYNVADYYSFEGENTDITFTSKIIEDEDIYDAKFAVGNVLYDWNFTVDEGKNVKFSDILDDKKLLIINFWYESSPSAVEQLKILNDLYSKYEDSVEIIAFNPVDNTEQISVFKETNSIRFPLATCSRRFAATFGISRCPTTVFVDRYGVISLLEVGTVSSTEQLIPVFNSFTNNKYEQKLYRSGITEFVSELLPVPTVFEVVVKDADNVKIPGVEIKLTTEESGYTVVTDEFGVAKFDVSIKENDIISVLKCPEGYKFEGDAEIKLSDAMFMYNIILKDLSKK